MTSTTADAITVGAVEALAERFKKLPEVNDKKRAVKKAEAVRMLVKEITALQGRGYSLRHILEMLNEGGVNIASEKTLGVYLSQARRAAAEKKAKPSPGSSNDTPPAPPPAAATATLPLPLVSAGGTVPAPPSPLPEVGTYADFEVRADRKSL